MSWLNPETQIDIIDCKFNEKTLRTTATNPDVIDWMEHLAPSRPLRFSYNVESEIKEKFQQGTFNCLLAAVERNRCSLTRIKNLFSMLSMSNQRLMLLQGNQKLIQSAQGNITTLLRQATASELIEPLPVLSYSH